MYWRTANTTRRHCACCTRTSTWQSCRSRRAYTLSAGRAQSARAHSPSTPSCLSPSRLLTGHQTRFPHRCPFTGSTLGSPGLSWWRRREGRGSRSGVRLSPGEARSRCTARSCVPPTSLATHPRQWPSRRTGGCARSTAAGSASSSRLTAATRARMPCNARARHVRCTALWPMWSSTLPRGAGTSSGARARRLARPFLVTICTRGECARAEELASSYTAPR
mmetsp:Transcript_3301/g.8266  ORF Transcript_3301/g.8266 Transcript_3301/m.8266 type:complete len:221 (-) Transcript_3301:401-1063(-)